MVWTITYIANKVMRMSMRDSIIIRPLWLLEIILEKAAKMTSTMATNDMNKKWLSKKKESIVTNGKKMIKKPIRIEIWLSILSKE